MKNNHKDYCTYEWSIFLNKIGYKGDKNPLLQNAMKQQFDKINHRQCKI